MTRAVEVHISQRHTRFTLGVSLEPESTKPLALWRDPMNWSTAMRVLLGWDCPSGRRTRRG
jgi:hypothetical protein